MNAARVVSKARVLAAQLREGDVATVAATVRDRWWSDSRCHLLRAPAGVDAGAAGPVLIAERADPAALVRGLDPRSAADATDRELRLRRIRLAEAGFGQGYAVRDGDGGLAYVQWVFGPEDDHRLAAFFGGAMPRLGPDELLLEGAYLLGPFRGTGLFPAALLAVMVAARRPDTAWFRTPVGTDNIPTLRGCARVGFVPAEVRTDRWRFFRMTTRTDPAPAGDPWPPPRDAVATIRPS